MSRAKMYSDEFKADAVNLIKEMSLKQVASKRGISTSTLHSWQMKSLGKSNSSKSDQNEELSYDDLLKKLKNAEKELRYANEINKVLKKSLGIMVQDHPETLKKIELLKDKIPISFSYHFFGVSKSGFYYWLKNKNNVCGPKVVKKRRCEAIKSIFKNSNETYGSPRVFKQMLKDGEFISKNTVEKYMNELGLLAKIKRKWCPQAIETGHAYSVANRVFKTEEGIITKATGELLAGDITYLKFKNKYYYLSVVMDLFSREIIGWSLNDTLSTVGISNALKKAIDHKKIKHNARVIFHSDRGSQYASDAYRGLLKAHNITPSMSRKGNCYDNAFVESFFKTFKYEFFFRNTFKDEYDLRLKIFYNIESSYNRERLHSSLGYLSPVEYKDKHQSAA